MRFRFRSRCRLVSRLSTLAGLLPAGRSRKGTVEMELPEPAAPARQRPLPRLTDRPAMGGLQAIGPLAARIAARRCPVG